MHRPPSPASPTPRSPGPPWSRRRERLLQVLVLVVTPLLLVALVVVAGLHLPGPAGTAGSRTSVDGLHVSGARIVNSADQPVRPLGVDRAGSEYMCDSSGDTTVFDGPSGATSVSAMVSWHINAVRVPLNEDCWLGINGYPAARYTAAGYRQAIVDYVHLLRSFDLMVILDLHWNGPGDQRSNQQQIMPDADHAPAFWSSVADAFKGDTSVVFDLYNEPHPQSWSCWRNGSSAPHASPCPDVDFAVAGMQALVSAVRGAGARNLIVLGGLAYANDLSGWLSNMPSDPLGNIAASFHLYNFNACDNARCWDAQVAPVAARFPVVTGELGENDCAHGFLDRAMAWLDQHQAGYLAWAWDTYGCGSFPALITSYAGAPTDFGAGFKDHLTALAGGAGATAGPRTGPSPVGPTSGPEPAATAASTGPAGPLQVTYANGEIDPSSNQEHPHLKVVNTGATPIDLNQLTLRYWYHLADPPDPSARESSFCDYAGVSCANVTSTFVPLASPRPGADHYLVVGFTAAAGTLQPGASSGDIQLRFAKADWSAFDGTSDYSWGSVSSYTAWPRITAYYRGKLVWGNEP